MYEAGDFMYEDEEDYDLRTFSLRFKSENELELVDILKKDITAGLAQKSFVTYTKKESRLDVWRLGEEGEFISRPQYLSYNNKNAGVISTKTFEGKDYVFMKNNKLVDVYEIAKNGKLMQIPVTTQHDLNTNDSSADYVFEIDSIKMAPDFSRFIISQGMYGVTDLLLK